MSTQVRRILPLHILNEGFERGTNLNTNFSDLPEKFDLYRSDRTIFISEWTMAAATVQAQTFIPYTPDTGPETHEVTRNLVEEDIVIFF